MKDSYTKDKGAFDSSFEEMGFYTYSDNTVFHVGQSYSDKPSPTVKCIQCGGTEFNVGSGEYFTAIRCPICGWETCIHDGSYAG